MLTEHEHLISNTMNGRLQRQEQNKECLWHESPTSHAGTDWISWSKLREKYEAINLDARMRGNNTPAVSTRKWWLLDEPFGVMLLLAIIEIIYCYDFFPDSDPDSGKWLKLMICLLGLTLDELVRTSNQLYFNILLCLILSSIFMSMLSSLLNCQFLGHYGFEYYSTPAKTDG